MIKQIVMRSIIVFFLLLPCVIAYCKIGNGCNDGVFRDADTIIIDRGDKSGCLCQESEQIVTVENTINGVKDGFWLSLPSRRRICITGRYTDGVMSGIWNVYGEDGTLTLSISNITVLADDNNYFHKVLDTEANVYIGLWREYNGKDGGTRSYWAIFSDDFEVNFIVIKRNNQLEQLYKSYNLL